MRESLLISDDKSLDPATGTGAMLHFVMIQSDGAKVQCLMFICVSDPKLSLLICSEGVMFVGMTL